MHKPTKTAGACDKSTASVLNRRRRSGQAAENSAHETVQQRSIRPARHLSAGTPRLVRLGSSVSAVTLILLAAACSGDGYASTGTGSNGAAPTTPSGPRPAAKVDLRTSSLGEILVDGQGRTLYLFEADKAGKSECNGGCASAWPPYLGGGNQQAGTGVTGALLGTTIRRDGATQVNYGGHPLYHYAGDKQPGDVTGQALDQFGAKWYALGPDGRKIDTD